MEAENMIATETLGIGFNRLNYGGKILYKVGVM